ncbi:alanine dehydrogenase [Stratiformator vulcanicus]|uniref:Alanine dehydrogenase n=1 Tax=Stratiformator vulcanicus TaxID=2527980 RepID=A0A517R3U5_9PLAN|nr:alanine dehydrogenase [Stratiformator vulcanicus]QDT38536.1 Alanine dehydrogenase [Stratiformator vulcanicus]
MIVGVPREVKSDEYRVAMLPAGVEELVTAGHEVLVERGAGDGSGLPDEVYAANGATIVDSAEDVFAAAELLVKVKEPQPEEWPLLRSGQMVFTYYHLAASEELTKALLQRGITAIAYETLRGVKGDLPLLTPMSEVAGRMSIQEGAKYLERPQEGRGILLGGVPGVLPATIVVLGGGIVGKEAARIAAGFGAEVVILDINVDRLRHLEDVMPSNVTTLFSDRHNIRDQVRRADLVIGGVLIPGARAPRLVTADDLKEMKAGAVIVDVCIDQGGCFETSRPTTHAEPTYIVDDIVHYCVTNMPGAVGRTSTYALCNVTFPFVMRIAQGQLQTDAALRSAINLQGGRVTNRAVADTFGLEYAELN